MVSQRVQVLLKASIPILIGIAIIFIYSLFSRGLVYCEWAILQCNSIPENLQRAVRVDEDIKRLQEANGNPTDLTKADARKFYEFSALEYSGRIMWTLIEATYFISAIIAIYVASYIIYKSLQGNKNRLSISVGAYLLAIMTGILFYQRPEILMKITIAISELTFDRQGIGFLKVFHFVNAIGFSAVALLAVAEVLNLLPNNKVSGTDFIDDLKHRTNRLNYLLFVGMILLVSAVLTLQSIFRWATAFLIQDPSTLGFFNQLAQNFITEMAIIFTAILMAFYLPGYFILRSYALGKSPENIVVLDKEKLKEIGLTLTPIEIISRFFAIIAPLVASPIIEAIMKVTAA